MDSKGRTLKQHHHVNLDCNFKKDCLTWLAFLQNATAHQLCRPFIDIDAKKYSTVLNLYSDASMTGFGAVYGDFWMFSTWGKQFIRECNPSIDFLELYALVTALVAWGKDTRLCNTRITVYCDNKGVRDMVNGLCSKSSSQCMKLIRILALDCIRYNRRIFVEYVKSKLNTRADALLRLEFDRFWDNSPVTVNKLPHEIPDELWPATKIWLNGAL